MLAPRKDSMQIKLYSICVGEDWRLLVVHEGSWSQILCGDRLGLFGLHSDHHCEQLLALALERRCQVPTQQESERCRRLRRSHWRATRRLRGPRTFSGYNRTTLSLRFNHFIPEAQQIVHFLS